jgi:hypothetical protein
MNSKTTIIHRKNATTDPLIIECRIICNEFTIRCPINFGSGILKHRIAIDQESVELINAYFGRLCQIENLNPRMSMLDKLILLELHRTGVLPFLQELCATIHDTGICPVDDAPTSPFDPLTRLKQHGFYKTVIRSLPYPNKLDELTNKRPSQIGVSLPSVTQQ